MKKSIEFLEKEVSKENKNGEQEVQINNIEGYLLVKSGILTTEEMTTFLSSSKLLNTSGQYNGSGNVTKLLDIVHNLYPANPAKGIAELTEISPEKVKYLLNENIYTALKNNVIISYVDSAKKDKLSKFINVFSKVVKLTKALDTTINKLFDLEESKQKLLIEYSSNIIHLSKVNISPEEIFNFDKIKQNLLMAHGYNIKMLVEGGVPLKEFFSFGGEKQYLLIEESYHIPRLVKENITGDALVDKLLSLAEEEQIIVDYSNFCKNVIDLTGASIESADHL